MHQKKTKKQKNIHAYEAKQNCTFNVSEQITKNSDAKNYTT